MKKAIVLMALLLMSSQISARMLFVPQEYATIQIGIDSSLAGDTVMVQLGQYHERVNLNGHNITLASTYLTTQEQWRIAETIIDGDNAGSVIQIENGEDSTCIVAGFTITNGGSSSGGGIKCRNSGPTITNNIIIHCYSQITSGGGIYCESGNPTICYNEITSNSAGSGGGIYCVSGSPIIRGNEITRNKATAGGGINCSGGSPQIIDNVIEYDSASTNTGGGIVCVNTNSIVTGNNVYRCAARTGGAISCSNDTGSIYNNEIRFNQASQEGGGIYTNGGVNRIFGNRIWNNSAQVGGGGMKIASNAVINNNIIFHNNSQGNGGAVQITGSPILYNNMIYENSGGYGGGIWFNSPMTLIMNSIIWGNSSNHGSQIYVYSGTEPTVMYCDIQNGWVGRGNISSNPLFRNTVEGDYHLKDSACGDNANSPCIDAGTPDIRDSLLSCAWGLGDSSSDIGVYGGGSGFTHRPQIINVPDDISSIQSAIDGCLDGDTILVQPGIYHENLEFRWHAPVLGSRYLQTNDTSYISSTIIDGNGLREVININRADSGAAIIGLTIRNGFGGNGGGILAQYSNARFEKNIICYNSSRQSGAGIACANGFYTISGNTFHNNNATHSGGAISCASRANIYGNNFHENTAGYYGGAVFSNYSNIIYSMNYFENNTGILGGAICCQGDPTISENIFIQNHATQRGGGVFCWTAACPTIEYCQFSQNFAELSGGGINISQGSNAIITNNNFEANECFYGAGIYCSADASIMNNRIVENNGPFGAGIYCISSNPTISGNQISWNSSSMRGAGIYCYDNASPLIMNNLIYENDGQGIYCYESSPMVINNNIILNTAEFGAGLYTWNSHPFVTNTIFWDNQSDQGPDIVAEGENSPQIRYCDIEQGWPGEGNISIPPLFRDIIAHDYHLSSISCGQSLDSPCIDAGWPDLPDSILDCMHGLGLIRSDIGAYGGDRFMVGIAGDEVSAPEQFMLEQNYPNPFNNQTTIVYYLPDESNVSITIYDLLGRVVSHLEDRIEAAGRHQMTWDASGLSSGAYFYRIETPNHSETKKMTLIK